MTPVVIFHPTDCTCGRHVNCERCSDRGVTYWWDRQGRHDVPCSCRTGRRLEEKT